MDRRSLLAAGAGIGAAMSAGLATGAARGQTAPPAAPGGSPPVLPDPTEAIDLWPGGAPGAAASARPLLPAYAASAPRF